jgi:N-acetyl-alpha-D-muramate 1-phosphate uridylyltransferase
MLIRKAMLFAAGRGERLRPLTDTCPKPLVKVGDKTVLDHTLDKLAKAGVQDVMINVWHLGDMILKHLKKRTTPRIHFSVETELLETGGGLVKVLDFFDDEPFLALNGDTLWQDRDMSALAQVLDTWDGNKMDVLLMLVPKANAHGYGGKGDYHITAGGQLRYKSLGDEAPYIYGGIQILHPSIFHNETVIRKFSLKELYDKAEAKGNLYGVLYRGDWFEIGTPQSLEAAREWFAQHKS